MIFVSICSIGSNRNVVGVIVKLSSGDMIPGDVRFLEVKDLFIEQASLTGESNPVEKFTIVKENENITDIANIGFMGTNVISGTATAIVLATGSNTYFGNMAKSLYSVNKKNSFEKGVDNISKLLIKFMVVMIPIILIINLCTKGDVWDSLLFPITIAVGLTPEMLPVIMTSTLAKGAVDEVMSTCFFIDMNGKAVKMTEELRKEAYSLYEKYNNDGLRILAVAQKNNIHGIETFGIQDESDMVLIGFVGFLDSPKESARQAITALKRHGVDTVVLTGDSEGVALQVCKKVGITVKNRLTGKEIENMTDKELKEKVKECHLYSKLSPLQKQRIVRIYQENGNTVGYMGDGINDSSLLKQADVGISVDTAVDIAKETADNYSFRKRLKCIRRRSYKWKENIYKYFKIYKDGYQW